MFLFVGVSATPLRDDQYSYQHIKAFGAQNLLYPDSFAGAVYVVDTQRKVVKISFQNVRSGRFSLVEYRLAMCSKASVYPDY